MRPNKTSAVSSIEPIMSMSDLQRTDDTICRVDHTCNDGETTTKMPEDVSKVSKDGLNNESDIDISEDLHDIPGDTCDDKSDSHPYEDVCDKPEDTRDDGSDRRASGDDHKLLEDLKEALKDTPRDGDKSDPRPTDDTICNDKEAATNMPEDAFKESEGKCGNLLGFQKMKKELKNHF